MMKNMFKEYTSYVISYIEMDERGGVHIIREEYFWKWLATMHYYRLLKQGKVNLAIRECRHSI